MKLLAFAATTSRQSINRALLDYAVDRLQALSPSTNEVTRLDLNDFDMPVYSVDREAADGIHARAQAFRGHIVAADALLIAFAEHNGSFTAAWKNTFDWMSRIEGKVFQDKPSVILSATPGPRAGAGVLGTQETLAPFFGMDLRASHGVGQWGLNWDGTTLISEAEVQAIDTAVKTLIQP